MPIRLDQIEPHLLKVVKPARYLGGEFNQIVKEGDRVKARVCLAFPDVYDLGMSYHGYSLLYERINANPEWAAERAFTPWPDFEAVLREQNIALYSLETRRALSEFDVVGFTLQHEVNYTNILSMLDLGGIPVDSNDRQAALPLIVGGGEGAFSPEPMARFIDAFVVGDGEEAIEDIMRIVQRAKAEQWDRERLLMACAGIEGVYVPQFYDVSYGADGRVTEVKPNREGAPAVIKKRLFNVTEDFGTVKPVVPLLRTVHDRLSIEIRRGCVNGCRFCQAGMITRPVRERSVEQIIEIASKGIAATGYDEISLLSLSSADYTAIGTLVRRMTREFGPRRISISLPSLRINAFDVDIADEIRGVRRSGFTFAPEAGTDRLRRVINKEVNQEDLFKIVEEVYKRGWQTVKFYFMIGLPTETDEDLDGIVEITRKTAEIARRHHGRKGLVNVTLSPFVPKSNTPFQWEPQPPEEELHRRYQYTRGRLRGRNIDVKMAETGSALIEAALARGDRRIGDVIYEAWRLGCKFDGWDEYFNKDLWLEAFRAVGLDVAFYANRRRGEDEVFPFDHIDSSLGKRFLWADQRRAWREKVMERCEVGKCAGCVACNEVIDHILAVGRPGAEDGIERFSAVELPDDNRSKAERLQEGRMLDDPSKESMLQAAESEYGNYARELADKAASCSAPGESPRHSTNFNSGRNNQPFRRFAEPERVMRVRIAYTKLGVLRYLAHLDMAKVIGLVLRRARAPLSYSEGFNSKPRVQFPPPAPLGYGGRREVFDAALTERIDMGDLLDRMNAVSVPGLEFIAIEEIGLKALSLDATVRASCFTIELNTEKTGWTPDQVREKLQEFFRTETFKVEVKKKLKIIGVDLRLSIQDLRVETEDRDAVRVAMAVSHTNGQFVKPHVALGFIFGRPVEPGDGVRIDREGFIFQEAPSEMALAGA